MKLRATDLERAYRNGDFRYLANLRARIGNLASEEGARAAEWIAHGCVALQLWPEAIELFESLARAEPGQPTHPVNLAASLLARGEPRRACDVLGAALKRWPGRDDIAFNLGLASFAMGRYDAAADALSAILSRNPRDDVARLIAVRSLQEMGRSDAAQRLARNWSPDWRSFALAELYQLAQLWIVEEQIAQAEEILRFIEAQHPDEIAAPLNRVTLLERSNRLDEAKALLGSLPVHDPDLPLALLVRAKLQVRDQAWRVALAGLDRALAIPPEMIVGLRPDSFRSEVQFLRGTVLDRIGEYDRAVAAVDEANRLARGLYTAFNKVGAEGDHVPWLSDVVALDAPVAAIRRDAAGDDVADDDSPVFLVGFPRSGTTLLDQMLDAHPALQVLEEKPALEAVVRAVDRLPGGYPLALLHLGEKERAGLREVYRDAVAREIVRVPGTRLVDKYPFNMVRIHLGMMLFPRARWIFAVRHPCDVVISCYMQNFRFTDVTHGFWSIDQSAALYRQIVTLWLDQRGRLAPACHDVRYESVVENFEVEARRLIAFLDLPWDDAILSYHRHALTRQIRTPSYSQVVQPIYRTSRERWRHYRPHMKTALHLLEPLIARLGYPAVDEATGGAS